MRPFISLLLLAVVGLFHAAAALAQVAAPPPPSCWPAQVPGGTGSLATIFLLDSGPVACWQCPGRTGYVVLTGDVSTALRNVGDRLDTIKAASAPADAASASWRRHVRYDVLTAPEMQRMRDELRHREMCGFRRAE